MNGAFPRAGRDWIRADAPIAHSRTRRFSAPTYGVEVELDHLVSSLHSLGSDAISGKTLRWRDLASEALMTLDRLERELARCHIPDSERRQFEVYFRVTRIMVETLMDTQSNDEVRGGPGS